MILKSFYFQLYSKGRLCQLGMEFSDLDTFAKVLKVNDKRFVLIFVQFVLSILQSIVVIALGLGTIFGKSLILHAL